MTTIIKGDVSNKIANLLSLATLVIVLKKDAATMAAMKQSHGEAYSQPQRSMGIGSTIVKVASNYALLSLRDKLGSAVVPSQFSVETKDGSDQDQWAM